MIKQEQLKGFTLLELLIVIAILSILAMSLILVLNPAETLKKSRDTQRMTDLSTLKTAIGLYLANVTTPDLSHDTPDNDRCTGGASPKVFYSAVITDTDVAGGVGNMVSSSSGTVDGNGWLPIELTAITSGAPISNFPLDPVNNATNGGSTAALVTNDALVYRYACNSSDLTYEIDAKLESTELTSGASNKLDKDGGDNANLFEVGTKLNILPTEANNNF